MLLEDTPVITMCSHILLDIVIKLAGTVTQLDIVIKLAETVTQENVAIVAAN
jgi:hypothetical protein